ncbi:4-alpha-glucanotransferase [Gammaproteobacteria bacterium]
MSTLPRTTGILLHPTSLPGPIDHGDLGPHAFYFVNFLHDCGVGVWQTLPLGPTHADLSPYNCISAHAGNPLLISADALRDEEWLDNRDSSFLSSSNSVRARGAMLAAARQSFKRRATPGQQAELAEFTARHGHWLEDYALYYAIRNAQGGLPWFDWPVALRDRDPQALQQARDTLNEAMQQACFEQFLFFRQWNSLKRHANAQGVRMFGDMAIFVAHDSADAWSHRECFQLDEQGQPTVVAGVPPDYFSATGQRWGNPLYDWKNHKAEVISLWVERTRTQAELFDMVRIDHFRGLESHWAIPAAEYLPTAGQWMPTPGDELLTALRRECSNLSLIAEDLGFITAAVDQLRRRHELPGMHVLQFGFDGDPHNHHLLHAHDPANVVYTGTHDNDTTLGWFNSLSLATQDQVLSYFGYPTEAMPWPMVRYALASVASLAILPMQDILGLGSEHRMNKPGINGGNWQWRFEWSQVPEEVANRLAHFTWRYGRNCVQSITTP